MTTNAVQAVCSIPGCGIEVHASGLCNPHYLIWYREQRQDLVTEVNKVRIKFGPPTDYFCEGATDGSPECQETPDRWWVKDGAVTDPLALCQRHTEEILTAYRKEIRRLEVKQ